MIAVPSIIEREWNPTASTGKSDGSVTVIETHFELLRQSPGGKGGHKGGGGFKGGGRHKGGGRNR